MKTFSATSLPDESKTTGIISAAFQAILDHTADMVFVKDANLVYVAASDPFVKMVDRASAAEIIGRTDFELFADENLASRYTSDDRKLLESGKNLIDYIEPLTDDNGHARYGATSKYILSDPSGKTIGLLGITRDITREYLARQHYQQELKYLFELPEDAYAAVFIDIDGWRIISQRRQLVSNSTLPLCNTVERIKETALEGFVDSKGDAAMFYRNFSRDFLWNIYKSGKSSLSLKYLRYMPDGSKRWVRNDIKFLTDPESSHLCVMLCARDIDAEKREELNLILAAKMDKMTMLLNRDSTMKYIQQILASEADKTHALFMLDVDNFKSLNDTLGHQAGDEFLITLARELQNSFRESDIVGRIGGDEFFMLMRNISGISAAKDKAQTLLSVCQAICANYPTLELSASIGISMYPENGKTLDELYTSADGTLYQAKKQGKNHFAFAPR